MAAPNGLPMTFDKGGRPFLVAFASSDEGDASPPEFRTGIETCYQPRTGTLTARLASKNPSMT